MSADPSITLSLPLSAMPAVTVTAPPPALVTQRNAEYLGLEKRDLLEILREMRRDPSFASEVIEHGKLRGAPPAAILAYLRQRPAIEPAALANDAGVVVDEERDVDESAILARHGFTAAPAAAARGGRRR